jgi:hypothetical protein
VPWASRATKVIPSITSSTSEFELNDYSKGINRYIANDVVKTEFLYFAQDARMPTLGEYETRKGCDYLSDGVGETIDVQQTSTTGASDQDFSQTARVAKKITFTTTGRCNRLDLNLKNSTSATGTVIVELWSNDSGAPGTKLARSSIAASDIDTSYGYETVRFINAPSVTATDYWVVVYVQANGDGSYKISSTTDASTGLTSTNSGSTWSASSEDYNVKAYLSTDSPVKGLHRAYQSDGTPRHLFAAGTVLHGVTEATGALTSIKTGLSANATHYRFVTVNDITYYVNGFDGYRKLTGSGFTTDAQVNADNATIICEHKGLIFLADKNDPNKVRYSNFADYEVFTSTDFIYVPSPKTGDPVTAMASVNGALMIWTRNKKFILYGDDNATFQLAEAPATARHGTYTQETIAVDSNFAYFLSEDGVYRFNGTTDELISRDIYEDIKQLDNKEKCITVLNQGRLHLYYPSAGSAVNDSSIVFNTNFASVESFDTDTYVSRAFNAYNDDDQLIVASSLVGQLFWQGNESNDYTNAGGDINYYVQTHYLTFGTPAKFKEIRYWKPRFDAQSGDYNITCEYAYDLRDNPTTQENQNVQGEGYTWGDAGTVWGSFTWGTTPELQSDLSVPGEYRRIQIRYKHYATRQPHKFLGHTFVVETRKLR